MRRELCAGCNSTNLHEVLYLGDAPLANNFPLTPQEAAEQKRYPLGLLRCHRCSLVQLTEVVPDDELWNGDYAFYTGSSWVAVQQQTEYADDLLRRFGPLAEHLTLEIACNDGTMLKTFKDVGCRTLGVDPARGPATQAQAAGLDVLIEGFGLQVAKEIVDTYGRAGLVVANNVIAHVADLNDFIAGIEYVLQPDGVCSLEFQYLPDLIVGNQIDQIYHEHRQFFSFYSLSYVLGRHNLEPFRVQQTTPQGGSLRVLVSHRDYYTIDAPVNHLLSAEHWLMDSNALSGLQGRAYRIQERLIKLLLDASQAGKLVAGYGASAKSATLLNVCDIGPELVQYFTDTTPSKQGRYMPGTGIPVINPQADSRLPDIYLVGIWNYLPQIFEQEHGFRGQWLVPIPYPVLL
jgi:SAM-dependent methyltransferase